jgi:hypothetical protein
VQVEAVEVGALSAFAATEITLGDVVEYVRALPLQELVERALKICINSGNSHRR